MDTKNCPTSTEDIEFYRENGFIQYPDFFTKEEITDLGDAIDDAITCKRDRILGAENGGRGSKDYERVFNQMVNLWCDYPSVKPYSFHKRLAESARRLSEGSHVRIYHDHAMIKPTGEISKETNWHQDSPYWPMEPIGSLSAWVAVDDVTIENGCLHFIPKSHKFGKLEPIALGKEGESVIEQTEEKDYEIADSVSMEMPAGGVTFHHGCTFHYAGANRSHQPRRAFAIIYIPDYVFFTGRGDAAGAADEMIAGGPWDHPVHPILAGN